MFKPKKETSAEEAISAGRGKGICTTMTTTIGEMERRPQAFTDPHARRMARGREPGEFGPLEGHALLDDVDRVVEVTLRDVHRIEAVACLKVAIPPGGRGSALVVVDVLDQARFAQLGFELPTTVQWRYVDDNAPQGRHSYAYIAPWGE